MEHGQNTFSLNIKFQEEYSSNGKAYSNMKQKVTFLKQRLGSEKSKGTFYLSGEREDSSIYTLTVKMN